MSGLSGDGTIQRNMLSHTKVVGLVVPIHEQASGGGCASSSRKE